MARTLIFIVLLLVAGCATSDKFTLMPGASQQAIIRDGVPELVSHRRNTVLLRPVAGTVKSSTRPTFLLGVLNRQSAPIHLSIANIKAELIAGRQRIPIKVFSYEELVAEEETRQAVRAFGAVLSAAGRSMQAANAGNVTTYGTYVGPGMHGTYTATTYDPARASVAQSIANAQTTADFAEIERTGAARLNALRRQILKDNTVMPGEWVGGQIVLDRPPKQDNRTAEYIVAVHLAGETHEFQIRQSSL